MSWAARVPAFVRRFDRSRNGGMVDTKDLKSFGHCGCVGSSPTFCTVDGRGFINEASPVFSSRRGVTGQRDEVCRRCAIQPFPSGGPAGFYRVAGKKFSILTFAG